MERIPTDGLNAIGSAEYKRHFAALPHIFLAGNLLRSCPHPFFRDGRLEIVACQYETGDHGEFHWHPEVTEYEYVVEGSVTYVAAETGDIRRFRSGDLAMVQPGTCVRRLIEEPCRTLAVKVPSNNVKVHCRQCSRKCMRRVEPFRESA
jgi:mannose-6-phosphate isomerase-like protein (cupin superfamily)